MICSCCNKDKEANTDNFYWQKPRPVIWVDHGKIYHYTSTGKFGRKCKECTKRHLREKYKRNKEYRESKLEYARDMNPFRDRKKVN